MFESMEDLMAAISGEYGEEAQEQALDFAEESGLLAEWAAHEEAEEASSYDDSLESEFQRLESSVGRRLSAGEEQLVLDSISPAEKREGVIPNLVQEYGPDFAEARNHEDGRVHLGAEAAQEVFDQQAAEQAQPRFAAAEPAGGGGRSGEGTEE